MSNTSEKHAWPDGEVHIEIHHAGRRTHPCELFTEEHELATLAWTPTVVEGTLSTLSSKRTSITSVKNSRRSSGVVERAQEEWEDPSQPPIMEEEERETREGTPQETPLEEAGEAGYQLREQWRSEFPLAALNALADFFAEQEDSRHGKAVSKAELERLATAVLSFRVRITEEDIESVGAHCTRLNAEELSFAQLSEMLSLLRCAKRRIESEDPGLMWTPEDLWALQEVFDRHSNSHGLAMANLFRAITALNIDGLDLSQLEQQQKVAEVTGLALGQRRGAQIGHEDFLRIVSAVLCQRLREQRREEFAKEWKSQQVTNFTFDELDDLRELHQELAKPSTTDEPLPRMVSLLRACGARPLTNREAAQLQAVINKHPLEERKGPEVPLDTFLLWMQAVFANGIGDLGLMRAEGLESSNRGFATAMLRESELSEKRFHAGGKRPPPSAAATVAATAGSPTAPPSERAETPQEEAPTRRSRSAWSKGLSARRKFATTPTNRTRAPAAGPSAMTTGRVTPTRKATTGEVVEDGIFMLRGLPPSEAMLARREFRACSVDLGRDATEREPKEDQPKQEGRARVTGADAPSRTTATASPMPGRVAKCDESGRAFSRKVKRVEEANVVVESAIRKLKAVEAEVEQQPSEVDSHDHS